MKNIALDEKRETKKYSLPQITGESHAHPKYGTNDAEPVTAAYTTINRKYSIHL